MSEQHIFDGFPQDGLSFLSDLAENNNREWFQANKQRYDTMLLDPAVEFVAEMGARLQSISADIRFDTRTNGSGSLMRIYRDTRFSKDKTPYKTGISGLFWEGVGKKNGCPAFGFHIEAAGASLMAGQFGFAKATLAAYREAVVDDSLGSELQAAITVVTREPGYEIAGEHYKRVPRGFDPDQPRADLLRYNGLYVHPTTKINPADVTSAAIVDICFAHFEHMAPVQQWLVKALGE